MTHHITKILKFIFLSSLITYISCSSNKEVNIVYPEGGYSYLTKAEARDSDFYFLPVRHTLSRQDSFMVTPSFRDLFKAFNEQNLSISPPKEDIFRFIYAQDLYGQHAIVKLSKNKIEIKVPKSGTFVLAPDETKLDPLEKRHFNLLYRNYPLSEGTFSGPEKRYADSLIKIYPELLDPLYYRQLLDKLFSVYQGPFEYSTKEIKLTNDKYKYFVDLINNSEYWKRPFRSTDHAESFADGDAFFLEAITKNKYQCIMSNMYLDGPSKFRKACDELIEFAGIAKEIHWETYEEGLNRPAEKLELKELQLKEVKEPAPKSNKKKAK